MAAGYEAFLRELAALLDKHKVEIVVSDDYDGHDNFAGRSIEFYLPATEETESGQLVPVADLPELLRDIQAEGPRA